MSDLVQRLKENFRRQFPAWTIQGEAAAEIERLDGLLIAQIDAHRSDNEHFLTERDALRDALRAALTFTSPQSAWARQTRALLEGSDD